MAKTFYIKGLLSVGIMLTTMCTTGQFRYRATVTKQLKKPIRTGVPRKTKIEWYTRHPFVNRWI